MTQPDRRPPWGILLLGLYLGTILFVTWQETLRPGHIDVFLLFRDSYYRLLHGENLYPAGLPSPYIYSPTFALLFAPFALPPVRLGLLLWNAVNALALYVALARLLPAREARLALLIVYFDTLRSLQNSQSNALLAALVVLAFLAFERGHQVRAALAVGLGTAVKIFPLAAVALAVFHPRRARFALILGGVGVALVGLPLLVASPGELVAAYHGWRGETAHSVVLRGASVMGIAHGWFGYAWPNWPIQAAGTLLLLLPLGLRPARWADRRFRLVFLGSLMVYMVIFNHKAESPSFVIATTGIAVWYLTVPRTVLTHALLALTVLVVAGSSEIRSPLWTPYLLPYGIKAVPCLLCWIVMQRRLLARGEPAPTAAPEPAAP